MSISGSTVLFAELCAYIGEGSKIETVAVSYFEHKIHNYRYFFQTKKRIHTTADLLSHKFGLCSKSSITFSFNARIARSWIATVNDRFDCVWDFVRLTTSVRLHEEIATRILGAHGFIMVSVDRTMDRSDCKHSDYWCHTSERQSTLTCVIEDEKSFECSPHTLHFFQI